MSKIKSLRCLVSVLIVTAFLGACTGNTGTVPAPEVDSPAATAGPFTPLPTAVPPDQVPGVWAVSFEHEFPPGFWDRGPHRYGFFVQCLALDQPNFSSEWQEFEVSDSAPLFENPIYLRLRGLSTGMADTVTPVIHPDQVTIAAITFLGVPKETAELAASSPTCESLFGWDFGSNQILSPGAPFQP